MVWLVTYSLTIRIDIGLADVGDRILLEKPIKMLTLIQGISVNDYSRVTEGFNLSDIIVEDKLNITDEFNTVNILLEDSSPNSIMQEDGTTTFGNTWR